MQFDKFTLKISGKRSRPPQQICRLPGNNQENCARSPGKRAIPGNNPREFVVFPFLQKMGNPSHLRFLAAANVQNRPRSRRYPDRAPDKLYMSSELRRILDSSFSVANQNAG